MGTKPFSCNSCTNSFCSSLHPQTRHEIYQSRVWVNYRVGHDQIFFLENRRVVIIEQGVVPSLRMDEMGRWQVIDILRSGDLLGCSNLFNPKERESFRIHPLTDCKGCMIPVRLLEDLLTKRLDLCAAVIQQMANRFTRISDNFANRALGDSVARLRYTLSLLGKLGIRHETLSHEDLALLSSLSRVTVTKIINTL